jgi:transposase
MLSKLPEHTLCERLEHFLPEMFVLVAVPGVSAHNNLAERSVCLVFHCPQN